MNSKSQICKSNRDQRKRHISAVILLGSIVFLIVAFSIQMKLHAATKHKHEKGPVVIPFNSEFEPTPIDPSRVVERSIAERRSAREQTSIFPTAIPAGTPVNNVSFFGIDLTSSVTAAADTDGDRVPDATENFFASDNPDVEATSAMAYSPKSRNFYVGIIAADGPNKQKGTVYVVQNPAGNYEGVKKRSFSTGKGTLVGMVVLDSPKGDILIVASVYFANKILGITDNDAYTITAYLPGADGIPDGTQTKAILPAGSKLGNNVINFSFGGLALDSKGNLYANAVLKIQQGDSVVIGGGAIVAFNDSDGDGIPDKPTIFAAGSNSDLNAITASSIVSLGGGKFAVLGAGVSQNQPTQIAIYTDADGNLVADGPPAIFFKGSPQFDANFSSFGDGSSGIEVSHMDFADGEALFSFNTVTDTMMITDSGVALVKDNGDGTASAPMRIFQAPKSGAKFGGITLVLGVPHTADTTPPTVMITSPTAGTTLNGNTMATINFTSTDNVGVVSHNIALAADGTIFNTPLASGLSGTTQTFTFTVPSLNTTTAVIRVQAFDAAGNVGTATVGPLTIQTDTVKPTVTVTSPKTKDKLKGGQAFTVMFMSSDNVGVVSQDIQLSEDGGKTFPVTLATGLSGTATSASVMIPNDKVKQAQIKVIAKDAAGNTGEGLSGIFKIKKSK